MVNQRRPDPVPEYDPFNPGQTVNGDVRAALTPYEDAFENLVTDRTNVLDIAAHYPYSAERWRLFVDGTRVFPEYETTINDLAQYTHADDSHDLQPAGGETVVLETTERPRYVVQYELAATWAFAVNQSLTGDDQLVIGLYNGSDGWYLEHNGDQADDVADFVLERNGSEVYRESDVDIHKPVTDFARLKLTTGWYDVTRQVWDRSFPDNGAQKNPRIGAFSADDQRGSRTGNLPLRFEITADASTSGLTLEAGSVAEVNLGETTQFTRTKTAQIGPVTVGTANTWVPIAALRVDPNRDIINTQLRQLDPEEFDGNGDIRVVAISVDPSNTDASGFATPVEHSAAGSVIEQTTAVSTFPDSTGTVGTSATNPGGYQVGYGSLYASQGGTTTAVAARGDQKRFITGRDVVVILANATTTGDVTIEHQTEQDW